MRLTRAPAPIAALVLVATLVLGALAVTITGFSDRPAGAAFPDPANGIACFGPGERMVDVDLAAATGYDVTPGTLGFATLRGPAGPGIAVRYVSVKPASDHLVVHLTGPATRAGCASWHLLED